MYNHDDDDGDHAVPLVQYQILRTPRALLPGPVLWADGAFADVAPAIGESILGLVAAPNRRKRLVPRRRVISFQHTIAARHAAQAKHLRRGIAEVPARAELEAGVVGPFVRASVREPRVSALEAAVGAADGEVAVDDVAHLPEAKVPQPVRRRTFRARLLAPHRPPCDGYAHDLERDGHEQQHHHEEHVRRPAAPPRHARKGREPGGGEGPGRRRVRFRFVDLRGLRQRRARRAH
mmetsp:Transcript_3152/g.9531  ORF Transcript_3152/g.9531 Transcript_3152/m.9531 type:complete len:235 (-) Transcript_3152:304-1008(-)